MDELVRGGTFVQKEEEEVRKIVKCEKLVPNSKVKLYFKLVIMITVGVESAYAPF